MIVYGLQVAKLLFGGDVLNLVGSRNSFLAGFSSEIPRDQELELLQALFLSKHWVHRSPLFCTFNIHLPIDLKKSLRL